MQKNISRLAWMHIFGSAQFHLVVYTLFLLSKGFTTQQFFLIESGFSLVALLSEIPTGALSDRGPHETWGVASGAWSPVR